VILPPSGAVGLTLWHTRPYRLFLADLRLLDESAIH
jgi:hypothetical protein